MRYLVLELRTQNKGRLNSAMTTKTEISDILMSIDSLQSIRLIYAFF